MGATHDGEGPAGEPRVSIPLKLVAHRLVARTEGKPLRNYRSAWFLPRKLPRAQFPQQESW
jgi:hypothetical protein